MVFMLITNSFHCEACLKFLTKKNDETKYIICLWYLGCSAVAKKSVLIFLGKQNSSLQRGVSRSSSVMKASLTHPPFVSSGSQRIPFSIVIVFSHLSSASPTSDGPSFFLLRCWIPDKISSAIATTTIQNITPNMMIQTGTDGSVGGARVEGIFKNSRVWSFKKKALLIRSLFILMADCTSTAGIV